ncbi:MAG TPA: bifunctional DNA-binding transcriptional regulator/O6-methylguanine-DNA methyltransferase Ada [Pyrinomonadaceae bacterium]|nr:bifunctional DNA-binding transcriptional regulator/O6-methylguanine-DNA methyltransferase Ada [Pyrinomonadaceae bacterium]
MNEATAKTSEKLDWQWRAVEAKDREFDGVFYFAVRTTGIFCRPSCPSKTAKRQNVSFFVTPAEAENAGFRACLRCKPTEEYFPGPAAELVVKAFEILRSDEAEVPTIEELSQRLNVTSGHLQKTFKTTLGLTPKEIVDMMRIENFKTNVRESDVTSSLYDSGFGSSRSLYEKAGERLGMTPATYKKGGKDMKINYTIVDSRLGKLMVARTEKGICSVSFGDSGDELTRELASEFFAAEIEQNDTLLKEAVNAILKSLDGETAILNLPLDLRASAFQMRVWAELRKIPYGETRSYADVAASLGEPKSFRAVARACATNPVALVNPCHRVISAAGKLSGYKWGIERKAELLKHEKETVKK